MDNKKHDDRLNRLPDAGNEKPEIFAIGKETEKTGDSRRSFLGKVASGAAVGGLAAIQQGCTIQRARVMGRTWGGDMEKGVDAGSCVGRGAHSSSVNSVTISPDGKLLASGSDDETINLWSMPDGALLKTLEGHSRYVNSVTISPDGKLLASGSEDATIKLWSMPDGALLKTLEGHSGSVISVAISPDGKVLASGSFNETIQLWSLPDLSSVLCLSDPAIGGKSQSFSTTSTWKQTERKGTVCTCNSICTCDTVGSFNNSGSTGGTCSCNTVCTCNTVGGGWLGGGCGYWHPN